MDQKQTGNPRGEEKSAEQRFSEAYASHANAILRFCWFRLFDRREAKDAVQEVFLRYWRYLAEEREIRNDRAFLYKVAGNLVIDVNARRVPQSLEALAEAGFDPADESHSRMVEFLDGLRSMQLLDQLEPIARQTLMLRYVDGLSSREIGEVTGDSEGAVNVRIHRSIKKLRALAESPAPDATATALKTAPDSPAA